MAEGKPGNRLYMLIGAIAVVVVVGGIVLFSGGESPQNPSTAEQPTTETPAATPPAATPPATTTPAPATPPAGETK